VEEACVRYPGIYGCNSPHTAPQRVPECGGYPDGNDGAGTHRSGVGRGHFCGYLVRLKCVAAMICLEWQQELAWRIDAPAT